MESVPVGADSRRYSFLTAACRAIQRVNGRH
jgi:hypothetical protein